jgi:hypothetical protein
MNSKLAVSMMPVGEGERDSTANADSSSSTHSSHPRLIGRASPDSPKLLM